MLYYPYGNSEEFPELGGGGRTACAGPVYYFRDDLKSETKFPRPFNRVLFIYEWTRGWIKAVHLDENYNVAKIEPFLPKQPFVRPIDLQFGPEGSLYVIEYGSSWGVNQNARLIRIDYGSGWSTPKRTATPAQEHPDIGEDDVLLFNPGTLKTRAEARRLESKVALVAAKKCSVEEVTTLHKELQDWLSSAKVKPREQVRSLS